MGNDDKVKVALTQSFVGKPGQIVSVYGHQFTIQKNGRTAIAYISRAFVLPEVKAGRIRIIEPDPQPEAKPEQKPESASTFKYVAPAPPQTDISKPDLSDKTIEKKSKISADKKYPKKQKINIEQTRKNLDELDEILKDRNSGGE